MNTAITIKFFATFCFVILSGCQKHSHTHHHDAPGSYKQSVNQQMHLPFHIEQKYEHNSSSSNDFKLNLQPPVSTPTFPQKQVKQNAKK